MKFLHLFFFILFVLGISHPVTAQSISKAISYNIRLDNLGDKQDNWHLRKQEMVDFIKNEQPDFFGIQEALIHQAEYLDGSLGNYNYIGVGRDDGVQAGEIMAIFYKKDKWHLIKDSTIWLSETPEKPSMGWDAACFRTCTAGFFQNFDGRKITILNTHFDHVGQTARSKSSGVILDFIKAVVKNSPVILLGDFNAEPHSAVMAPFFNSLQDTKEDALFSSNHFEGTYNGFKLNSTYPRRIDYIFVSNHLTPITYVVPAPKTRNGRQLSDHFPIIVQYQSND
jgi:endonuclease/exonuclease/phosphatase family metal-dependent hydrolase